MPVTAGPAVDHPLAPVPIELLIPGRDSRPTVAYTGSDSDGGLGYVTERERSVRDYLKRKLRHLLKRIR